MDARRRGLADTVSFLEGPELTRGGVSASGLGRPVSVDVVGGAVWINSVGGALCFDPRTGRERAHTEIPADNGSSAYLTAVVDADGQLFSSYRGSDPAPVLVRLHPPEACTP